jgi:hypothetical protein
MSALARIIRYVVVAFVSLASVAVAQQEQGDKEIGIGGSISYMKPADGSAAAAFGSVQASLGVFATRNLKLSAGTSLSIDSPSGEGTTTSGTLVYGGSYYFGAAGAKTYPYIGAGGATSFSGQEGAASVTSANGYLGLQHFVNRNASFFVQADIFPSETATSVLNTFGFRVVF